MKKTFKIKGMHCNSCAQHIEDGLKDKVNHVKASYSKGEAEIDFDEDKISEEEIKTKIEEMGYECAGPIKKDLSKPFKQKKGKRNQIGFFVFIGALILLFFILYKLIGGINVQIPGLGENTSLILLFFAGILTGFHCISMCGAFVVSYTTKNALKGHKSFKQHLVYGGAKVFSYALIGAIFGLLGGIVAFSVQLRGIVAIVAGLFMIVYALGMMGIRFFKRFQFNPKFIMKATSKASKHAKGPYRAPLITGLLSGLFIACGPLQAMYLYAAGTGSIFQGALGLAAFGLGTLPVMLGFGSLATVISHKTTRRILKIAALIVLILGIIMLNRGLVVMGSPISYDSLKAKVMGIDSSNSVLVEGYQEINMEVNRYGWEPDSFVIKKGVPVKWNIDVKELTGCNNEIIVNEYDLDIKLEKGLNVVEFTPDKAGTVGWSCWMGMIPGSFIVTETGEASQQEVANEAPQSSGGCTAGSNCGSTLCGAAQGTGGCGCGG